MATTVTTLIAQGVDATTCEYTQLQLTISVYYSSRKTACKGLKVLLVLQKKELSVMRRNLDRLSPLSVAVTDQKMLTLCTTIWSETFQINYCICCYEKLQVHIHEINLTGVSSNINTIFKGGCQIYSGH